jgi:hypothetical protein
MLFSGELGNDHYDGLPPKEEDESHSFLCSHRYHTDNRTTHISTKKIVPTTINEQHTHCEQDSTVVLITQLKYIYILLIFSSNLTFQPLIFI